MTVRGLIEELLQFNMDATVYCDAENEKYNFFSFSWSCDDNSEPTYKTKRKTDEVYLWLDDTCEREKGNGKDNG